MNEVYSGEVYKVPAIVHPDKWEKVNQNLSNNRNNSGKKVVHQYLLKGLLRCGVCGRNMYGRRRINNNDNHYICSSKRIKDEKCSNRSINISKLEAFIWDRFFKGDEFLNRIRNEFSNDKFKSTELKKQIQSTQEKLTSLNNEKKRAIELVVKGTISEDDVKNILQKTNQAIKECEFKLKENSQVLKATENNARTLRKYDDEFAHFTSKTTFLQRKKIINDFIKNIIIKYDNAYDSYDITIEFKIALENESYRTYKNFTYIQHKDRFY